jgi:hypothetical protein
MCRWPCTKFAADYACERGVIIADTKFEFGTIEDELVLVDEMCTPDSSALLGSQRVLSRPRAELVRQTVRARLPFSLEWDKTPPAPALPTTSPSAPPPNILKPNRSTCTRSPLARNRLRAEEKSSHSNKNGHLMLASLRLIRQTNIAMSNPTPAFEQPPTRSGPQRAPLFSTAHSHVCDWLYHCLVLSGAMTRFPRLCSEPASACSYARWRSPDEYSGLLAWIVRVRNGLLATQAQYPFLAYGTDWLAFAHLVIATAFWGR